ncbi:MAG: hypothetical protein WD597_11105 [Balneolaceae bacterium]
MNYNDEVISLMYLPSISGRLPRALLFAKANRRSPCNDGVESRSLRGGTIAILVYELHRRSNLSDVFTKHFRKIAAGFALR